MKTEEFINLCQGATHGSQYHVRHLNTKKRGVVTGCSGDYLTVLVGADTEIWGYHECEAVE